MGYRTIKRAFGETNLERKCRLLFGVCLGLLIGAAFIWVDRIGERLVKRNTRQIGHDWVKMSIFHLHWLNWQTNIENKPLAEEMSADLLTEEYELTVLSAGPDEVPWQFVGTGEPPADSRETELLKKLRTKWRDQIREPESDPSTDPVFEELTLLEGEFSWYCYYEPVYWKESCQRCHGPIVGAFSASESSFDNAAHPYRVVKIKIPYEATRDAIHNTRAILIAAAILTVFVAMVLLYMIVRYVIVKPLKHLRDVSDEISRGSTELRADIQTNDEFEELAGAFNRMLRHLIEAQSELRHLNENLDAKVDELAQLNMRLYEMNRLKSDFLANMSHELRTPLNSIIGFSEVLQGIDSLSDKQKRYAHNIQKSGRVLLEMINDILDLAKLEAGKMEVRPAEFQIETIVTAQCDMVRSLTDEKNIDLEVQVPDNEPPLFQDQSKVQQILTNLLSNAIKFTPEGGRITVRAVHNTRDELEMTVADTGVGIPDEDREIIFEKFRQSKAVLGNDGLTREYSGTGLGLSIVKELSKLLGGEIVFESELGRGSSFKVVLPWTLAERPRFGTEVTQKLEALSHPSRNELTPQEEPPAAPVTHNG